MDVASDVFGLADELRKGVAPSGESKLSLELPSPIKISHTLGNFEVEVPLTPRRSSPDPNRGAILVNGLMQLSHMGAIEEESTDPDSNEFAAEGFLASQAGRVASDLEHESLMDADSVLRVNVPIMNCEIPTAPWESLQGM
jgi:hypothetical protein